MSKNLIVTCSFGDREFTKLGKQTIEAYAKRCGADFKVITSFDVADKYKNLSIFTRINGLDNTPYIKKVLVLQDCLRSYDRVLLLDDTCFVNKDCPNLFDTVPKDYFAMFNEGSIDFCKYVPNFEIDYLNRNKIPVHIAINDYGNTGVLLASKCHDFIFSDENILELGGQGLFNTHYGDQTYINYCIQKFKVPYYTLSVLFNKMYITDKPVVYSDEVPDTVLEIIDKSNDFSSITKESILPGQQNHAFIWHFTGWWSDEKREKIFRRLHEII